MFYAVTDIGGELFGVRKGKERKLRDGEFWALNDVSFELRRGQAVGVVGANGAGKTTLLKLVSGLIKPDHGNVMTKGRLAPLIALGAGFNATLSGKENIYVNMSILGLTKQQIDERINDVIEFAEIGHAIDAPVSTYSSGMAARLGFSCAIHTDPDILLIDEVLAVGDVRFRMKCYRKLAQLRAAGSSFLLVSHSASSLLSVCNDAIYLKKGVLMMSGDVPQVLATYEQDLFGTDIVSGISNYKAARKDKDSTTGVDIESIYFEDVAGVESNILTTGDDYRMVISGYAHDSFERVSVSMLLKSVAEESNVQLDISSYREGVYFDLPAGNFKIFFGLPSLSLSEGSYTLKVNLNIDRIRILDGVETLMVRVKDKNRLAANSTFLIRAEWSCETKPQ